MDLLSVIQSFWNGMVPLLVGMIGWNSLLYLCFISVYCTK